MGIYDRDYYRQERPSFSLAAPRTIIGIIILINAAIYVADYVYAQYHPRSLAYYCGARIDTLTHPWLWWQFVTYGFLHSLDKVSHVVFNMLALFFLGQDVEATYGRKEFLRLYLVLLAVGGAGWALGARLAGAPDVPLVGASAAVTGVVILYALLFPRRTILLFFVIPVPAWLLGMIVVVSDMLGASGRGDPGVAYTAHLAGAAFAIAYYYQRWNLTRWTTLPDWIRWRPKPRLRIHEPESADEDLNTQVDQILEKISREGEQSLSRKERRILENASREFQKRRRSEG